MNNMKINIPEGFEIDKENSSLETGEIVFKKVEIKYPTKIKTSIDNFILSKKYGKKLEILDSLISFRDEYNRIDGFEECFMSNENNWCLSNYNNKLKLASWSYTNRIIYFGKRETAKLFLNNFEEQLEQVKEFL